MFFFTIVRHGETKSNVARIVQGRTDGELTENGINMAKSLGTRLKDEKFTHIFSSDLKRCRDTTANILAMMKDDTVPKIGVEYKPILQERDYGEWEFQDAQVCTDKMKEMGLPKHKHHQVEVPKGETYEECKARAGRFFSEIVSIFLAHDAQDEKVKGVINILAVSHGTFIVTFIEYLRENPDKFELVNFHPDDMLQWPHNTAMTRFAMDKVVRQSISSSTNSNLDSRTVKIRLTFSHFYDAEHIKYDK